MTPQRALIQLRDALRTWERATGLHENLLLVQVRGGWCMAHGVPPEVRKWLEANIGIDPFRVDSTGSPASFFSINGHPDDAKLSNLDALNDEDMKV